MESTVLTQLGSRIREKRKALGWTQEELADRAQIDRSYLGGVERGERNVTFTVLSEICAALGCDVGEIVTGIRGITR
ncbi:helix-turn-helix domain-containing protein [Burkholderia pseudomallei]|uniref:helix-turn-helix domain-containing protein n=1 Tax=Burkholderia pseudomallei TaxID=28450 RepID=UPI00057270BE|nr:helix-turn-helix transcriptional regulator [Burkholderia pseudomallei]